MKSVDIIFDTTDDCSDSIQDDAEWFVLNDQYWVLVLMAQNWEIRVVVHVPRETVLFLSLDVMHRLRSVIGSMTQS